MKLAAHELYNLHELTLGCANFIATTNYMLQHATDPDFRSILETHYPLHVRNYNRQVAFLNQTKDIQRALPLTKEEGYSSDFTTIHTTKYPPFMPRVMAEHMNDREMATSYLLDLKRTGREFASAAMEMSNPEIRSSCQGAFMTNCAHAYEIWKYMVRQGHYPLEPADSQLTGKISAIYQPIPEDQPPIQQYAALHHNFIAGRSDQLYQ